MSAIIRARQHDAEAAPGAAAAVVAMDHAPPLLGALARALLRAPATAASGLVRPRLGDGRRGCAEFAPYDAIVLGAGGPRARAQ
jgi:protein-L-isoaspartate O-methyltransferase